MSTRTQTEQSPAASAGYANYVQSQLDAAISVEMFDAAVGDPLARLLIDAATALVRAGLNLANPQLRIPQGDPVAGVELTLGERVVIVSWGHSEKAPEAAVNLMLATVADLLRTFGFVVDPHPDDSTYLITGTVSRSGHA